MHANAPLTSRGRLILVERIASGRPVAHVAAEMGVSRKTADKWWKRWLAEGEPGLEDRSSPPAVARIRPRSASSDASSACAGGASLGRPGSPASWVCPPRRCTGCCRVTA